MTETTSESESELLAVRSVNEWVFCPRLFWYEEVSGVFVDNRHTLEGRRAHRRVDRPGGKLEAPEEELPDWQARSLWLSSSALGITGKVDLVEQTDGAVMPVDTKKGRVGPEGLWPPDAVQLALQGLLLREAGYRVDRVAAWYVENRRRVVRDLDEALCEKAIEAVAGAQACLASPEPPDPLLDSPKCVGCSLNVVCLPDETNALAGMQEPLRVRRVVPVRDDQRALYVQSHRAKVRLAKACLLVEEKGDEGVETTEVGINRISQVNLFGGARITSQAIQACLRRDLPVCFFSGGGWFYGRAVGFGSRQVEVRRSQFAAAKTKKAVVLARTLVADKIANGRTLLRRNGDEEEVLSTLRELLLRAEDCGQAESLLGLEGNAAQAYWSAFGRLLAKDGPEWMLHGRTRRPPRDRSNAMLSFGYAFLAKDCTLAVVNAGLDPQLGLYHTVHHGRPSMALDLMEPFRPLVVDSCVLQLIRRKEVRAEDFVETGQAVVMKERARRKLISAYERRMDETIRHPVFGYKISYRQLLGVHARLITRFLMDEIEAPPSFRTR